MLVTTKLAVADTTDRFASVGCWPEIGLVQVEAVSAWNVDRYDAKSLEKKHSVYTDSFETTCQGVRVKVERHPTSGTGMCGADPSADIYVWLDGKPVLNRELFGNSCGSSYIQKVQVDLGDELVVCLAGWWKRMIPRRIQQHYPTLAIASVTGRNAEASAFETLSIL